MKHTEIFEGIIGSVGDLRALSNDNYVINFTVAETPRVKKGDDWVDGVTVWTRCTMWGKKAQAFAESKFDKGTPVIIYGTREASNRDAWNDKDGNLHPATVEQDVNVQSIGLNLVSWIRINDWSKATSGESNSTPAPAAAPAAQRPAASANKPSNKPANKPAPAPAPAAADFADDDDPFADVDTGFGDDDFNFGSDDDTFDE